MPKKTSKLASKRKQTRLWWWVGGLAVIAIVVASAGSILADKAPETTLASKALPAEISVEGAYQKYQEGAFVLDVRTPEEWNEYHAPGTTLIPLDELPNRLDEIPSDQEVVVVCRSGNRSQAGREILLQGGFTSVTSMAGGLNAWSAAGYPIEGTRP